MRLVKGCPCLQLLFLSLSGAGNPPHTWTFPLPATPEGITELNMRGRRLTSETCGLL